MVALVVLDGLVGFPASLSPTSFHLSPNSFHLFPPKLGACGRVPGWLVSHSLSFVSHFFSLVSQFFNLSLRLGACLSPTSFHLSLRLGACGGVPGWLVSHFFSFVSLLVVCLWSGSRLACLPLPFILGACARIPGRLVSHFLECVSHFFSFVSRFVSHFLACVSHFLLFVSRFFCLPCLSLLISAHFRWPCSISIHVPGLSLLVSALVRWPRSISILLSCRSVTGVSLCIGHEAFLFICLPGPSLLVPCSIHLFPKSVTAAVRPFPLAM